MITTETHRGKSTPDKTLAEKKAHLLAHIQNQGVPENIIALMNQVERQKFVSSALAHACWDDAALPIGAAQSISQPTVVAWMTTLLEPDARMRVLEIGTGCGYQTAILAKTFRRVYTVERHRSLHQGAVERFADLRLHNVTPRVGDGALGWPEAAPFPRIIATAAASKLPPAWIDQLAPGGILIAPLPDDQGQLRITRIMRQGDSLQTEYSMPVHFVPLVSKTLVSKRPIFKTLSPT